MIDIPTEDGIRGLSPNEATALATALLFQTAPPDLLALRDLLITARRALVQVDVDHILLDEAIDLYEALGLDTEQDSDDPLDYLTEILTFWGANLP